MVEVPGMESVGNALFPYLGEIFYWIGVSIISLVCIIGLYALYYYISFNIKVMEFPLYGSGKDGIFSFGKPRSNRVKWINKRTAWRSLFPLFNKFDKEPLDSEFVYPGNRVFVFTLGNEWIPGRININKTEKEIRTQINPVPYYVRNWQSLQHKKNAQEFAEHTWWEDNKYFIMGVIAVSVCCLLAGVTIWFSYKFGAGGVAASQNLADALKTFGTIPGK